MLRGITISFILIFSTFVNAAFVSVLARSADLEKDIWDSKPVYYYSTLKLPKELTREFLTLNIQSFYNQYHDAAFKHLGDWRDFDHAHLLKDQNNILRGLLFHTQERANAVAPGSRFKYVNKDLRNWILFTERPLQFENAVNYRYKTKPTFWNEEYEKNVTWVQYEQAGTVVELMLDPNKTGFEIQPFMSKQKTEQIYFKKAICPSSINPNSNIIKINTKEGIICLYVSTMPCTLGFPTTCPARPL